MKMPGPHNHLGVLAGSLFLLLLWALGSSSSYGQSLHIERNIEKSGEKQFLVKVDIQKRNVKGYAKLEEHIPEGFVAYERETRSANFIFKDGKAKFIWMDIPEEDEFQVRYRLIQKENVAGTFIIKGRLSCVSGDDLLRYSDSSKFKTEGSEELTAEQENGEHQGPDRGEEVSNEPGPSQEEAEGKKPSRSEGKMEKAEEASSVEGIDKDEPVGPGRSFSVQVGAFSEKKERSYFVEEYGLEEQKLHSHRQGELYKYSLGSFNTYAEAEKEKERLRESGIDAFIIGIREGEPVKATSLLK